MICQFFAPHPALRNFVQKYLLIRFVFDPAKPLPFKPYPAQAEHIMAFTLEGFDQCENPQTGQRHRVIPNAIFGQALSRVNLYPSPTYKLLRVYFQPGVMFRLFGIPLHEFTGSNIDTESFIGSEVRPIHEQLGNAATYNQMVDIMNVYLLHKVSRIRTTPHGMDRVADLLRTNPTGSLIAIVLTNTNQYEVRVIDSSKSPHGKNDSRRVDDEHEYDGLGQGNFRLYADLQGNLVGYSWSNQRPRDGFNPLENPVVVGRLTIQ